MLVPKMYGYTGTKWDIRLYQVGNTSSQKNTEVKQLGPLLALGWVAIQGIDGDAVATNIVKSQKRRTGAGSPLYQLYASGATKKLK